MVRIGNVGINTSYVIKKSLLKKKLKGGNDVSCQDEINKEILGQNEWLQLNKVLQSLKGKGISTLIGRIPTKEVVIKIQEAEEAKKEYEIQEKIKDYEGFIKYECIFFCDGDKEYIESFARLNEHQRLCKAKGVTMGTILMPYYKNGSLDMYDNVNKNIITKVLYNYLNIYNITGFTHCDFFPKNVILDDDMNPIIIDFEKSYFNHDKNKHTYFWRDLTDFISYVKYKKDLANVIREHCMMNGAYNRQPTKDLIDKLVADL